MDILTLKSKVKLGCNMCDKCCIYRGDIKLTPVNVCEISKFLNIPIIEFLEKYTDKMENRPFEKVLKTTGNFKQCILYDENIKGCGIHKVKPMQCTMFPLVPENLNQDYFYDSEQCKLEEVKEITVDTWLNGNNNNYKKHKKSCMEWIKFLDYIYPKIVKLDKKNIDEYNMIIFQNYDLKKKNFENQMYKNLDYVASKIKKQLL